MIANEKQILFLLSTTMDSYSFALIVYDLVFKFLLYLCTISSHTRNMNLRDFVFDMIVSLRYSTSSVLASLECVCGQTLVWKQPT
jgi:hypothetical protein